MFAAFALLLLPGSWATAVHAQTRSALADWRQAVDGGGGVAASRAGTTSVPSAPYSVISAAQRANSTTRYFSNLVQAQTFAKGQQSAIVVNNDTGLIMYSNVVALYEVHTPALTPNGSGGTGTVSSAVYTNLGDAIAAASSQSNATVVNRLTGAVLWSNASDYAVTANGSTQEYQTYEDALAAAGANQNASIAALPSGMVIWRSNYAVDVGNAFSRSFFTLTDAEAYAAQQTDSQVVDIATGTVVWDNIPQYAVYQNGALMKEFASQSAAVSYANTLSGATVEQLSNQAVVYSNVPNYLVEAGGTVVKTFGAQAQAQAYAATVSGSLVVQESTGQIVYTQAGPYGVYQYLGLLKTFPTSSAAIAYAKTQGHVQVVDKATNAVLYSNYPSSVKTPYGDTFTVQNGMVVDHWGQSNTVLAPAPVFMKPGTTYVSNDYYHWYAVQQNGDVYVGTWENPYRTFNLETGSTLTAAQINAFFAKNASSSSVLQNSGKFFIEAEKAYGVNAQYLVAHAIIESAWGTSYFAMNRNNLFGYQAYTSNPNAAATFRSVEYDINFQAWFVRNSYLNASGLFFNGPNLDGMNVDYATATYWSNSIARVMSQIAPFSASIAGQPQLPEQGARPFFPYPTGAKGMATVTMNVYSFPPDATTGTPTVLGAIPKGQIFSVAGDSPGWDRVTTASGVTGFVNWNDVSLQNVLEVTGINAGSTLAVLAQSSGSSPAIDQVTNGVYLVYSGSPVNGWYHIVDGNGKTGWVWHQYVMVIH